MLCLNHSRSAAELRKSLDQAHKGFYVFWMVSCRNGPKCFGRNIEVVYLDPLYVFLLNKQVLKAFISRSTPCAEPIFPELVPVLPDAWESLLNARC